MAIGLTIVSVGFVTLIAVVLQRWRQDVTRSQQALKQSGSRKEHNLRSMARVAKSIATAGVWVAAAKDTIELAWSLANAIMFLQHDLTNLK